MIRMVPKVASTSRATSISEPEGNASLVALVLGHRPKGSGFGSSTGQRAMLQRFARSEVMRKRTWHLSPTSGRVIPFETVAPSTRTRSECFPGGACLNDGRGLEASGGPLRTRPPMSIIHDM